VVAVAVQNSQPLLMVVQEVARQMLPHMALYKVVPMMLQFKQRLIFMVIMVVKTLVPPMLLAVAEVQEAPVEMVLILLPVRVGQVELGQ
jgi:hypothetical protein